MMKFIPFEPSLKDRWDQAALNSDDASVFHLADWLLITQAHWPLEPKSFLVEHEGKIAGILPLQLNKRSHSLKSTYLGLGGPALANGLQEGVRKKILKSMYEHVHQIAAFSQSPFIEIILSPLSPSSLQNRWQVNPLVHHGYEDTSTHSWIIDLSPTVEEIFKSYSDDARHSIKNAADRGYRLEKLSAVSQIDQLYEVHCENRKRTGAATHPKGFFMDFYKQYCAKNLAVIWMALDPKGELAAYQVTSFFRKSAYYWMGGCKAAHLESGVNYLLQAHAIRWAKEQGAGWYENGEAFPNIQEGKMHGLSVFKGKFGGQLHRFFKGKITMNHPGRIRRLTKSLTKILTGK